MTRSCTTGGGSIGRRSAARVVVTSTVSCFPHFPFYRHRRHNPYHIVHPTIIRSSKKTNPRKKKKRRKKKISSAPNPDTKKAQSQKRKVKKTHTPFVPTPHIRACFGSWRTVSSYSLSSHTAPCPDADAATIPGSTTERPRPERPEGRRGRGGGGDCGYLWCSRMYASVD